MIYFDPNHSTVWVSNDVIYGMTMKVNWTAASDHYIDSTL